MSTEPEESTATEPTERYPHPNRGLLVAAVLLVLVAIMARISGDDSGSRSTSGSAGTAGDAFSYVGDFEGRTRSLGAAATINLAVGYGTFTYKLIYDEDGSGHTCSGTFNAPNSSEWRFRVTFRGSCSNGDSLNEDVDFRGGVWLFQGATLTNTPPRY